MSERDDANGRPPGDGARSGRLIRSLDAQRVLEAILQKPQASPPDVAARTKLPVPAVREAVSALERAGLVRRSAVPADGVGPAARRRLTARYEVDDCPGYVFGVDLGGTKVRAGLADMYGTIVVEIVEPTVRHWRAGLVHLLDGMLTAVLRRAGVDRSLVRAAGVGVPGVYEAATDAVLHANNLPPLAPGVVARSTEALGIPIVIDNDVNLATVGERWRGHANDCTDFVVIAIGTGVGMGLVVNGEVYAGATGAAGEIGLLPVGVEDPFDGAHGAGGPFEAAASGAGALRRLRRLVAAGSDGTTRSGPSTLRGALEAAARGDRLGRQFVDDQARLVALGVSSVCAVLDPQLVVLGGGLGAHPILLPPVRRHVRVLLRREQRIEVSGLRDRAGFHGAIAAGLAATRRS